MTTTRTPQQLNESLILLGKELNKNDLDLVERIGRQCISNMNDYYRGKKDNFEELDEKLEEAQVIFKEMCRIATIIHRYIQLLQCDWKDDTHIVSIQHMENFVKKYLRIQKIAKELSGSRLHVVQNYSYPVQKKFKRDHNPY